MKIGDYNARPSLLHYGVVAFFSCVLLVYVFSTGNWKTFLLCIPLIVAMLAIPMGLNYLSQREYANILPYYKEHARSVKIREINERMISTPIRLEGIVEQVRFKSINRPHFIIADRTGSITVKMFTSPGTEIHVNDRVVVYGQVIHRYIAVGDPVVNGVSIETF
ncbi:MAG: nucleotide-binding protein [Methanomicrobiales archaeon]|jgi:DNA/RNA endonuclease YhcR with UshA esterase domain|nr:nucleotide-binding protein [Methanomicrobiales archaeon]